MSRILLVEDDPKLSKLLISGFELEGYDVRHTGDGAAALELISEWQPALIVLDVMLPGMSGYDICRTLRKEKNRTPILMLTAKGHEAEKVVGLDMGADDYMTKPFSGLELMARVRALLRRSEPGKSDIETVSFGGVTINFRRMEAKRGKTAIPLTVKEFEILKVLVSRRGDVVSREDLYRDVWGHGAMPTTRTIDTHIQTLRQKLSLGNDNSASILTVHGAGYKFVG